MMVRLIIKVLLLLLIPCQIFAATTTSITQRGITWTFDVATEYGQFVNGDYWVVDPGTGVNITGISPGYIQDGTRKKNGSMINPQSGTHGYDNSTMWYGTHYSDSVNVGIGITPSTPLNLSANESLVSTISNDAPGSTVYISLIKTVCVLTCLSTAPPANSFRPAYSPSTKTIHNSADVDRTKLETLAYSTTKPDITTFVNYSTQPFIDHDSAMTARFLHPSDSIYGFPNNYTYAREMSEIALLLHLDYTAEQKEPLLINFIQLGIDLYGYIEAGMKTLWKPDGGHASGRKWPILFAGIMLDYAPMKGIGDISGDYLYTDGYGPQATEPGTFPPGMVHFGEDGQCYYVKQFDIDLSQQVGWTGYINGTSLPYEQSHLGMPEWSIRHSTITGWGDRRWAANYRESYSNAFAWAGSILAARIMEAKNLWNADATFAYTNRHWEIINGRPDPCGFSVEGETAGDVPGGPIFMMYASYGATYGANQCELGGGEPAQVGQSRGTFLIGQ